MHFLTLIPRYHFKVMIRAMDSKETPEKYQKIVILINTLVVWLA